MTGDERFKAALEHARRYEKAVAAWLMRRGWRVLPVYDYSGGSDNKAPKLQAALASASLVTPDIFMARGGHLNWVEVKFKTSSDFTRKTQRQETGIDLRLWNHYREVKKETAIPVWIVFIHERQREIVGAEIDTLGAMVRESPNFNGGRGGVFFAVDALRSIADFDEICGHLSTPEAAE